MWGFFFTSKRNGPRSRKKKSAGKNKFKSAVILPHPHILVTVSQSIIFIDLLYILLTVKST